MNKHYPDNEFGSKDGALLLGVRAMAGSLQSQKNNPQWEESAFDLKQRHARWRLLNRGLFKNVRPSILVGEAESAGTFAPEVVTAQAAQNVVDLNVPMSNVLE